MTAHRIPAAVDVAVTGGGPAGIAAAATAAESGRSVVVLDEGLAPGGQIWRHAPVHSAPPAARRWLARLERSGAQVLRGAAVVAITRDGDGFVIAAEAAGEPCRMHAGALVIATGARERFVPFPGWTLPGVVGVGGAQALLKSGASFAGKRVVIAGSGPLLLPVAAALARGGARLVTVAEQASAAAVRTFAASLWRTPAILAQAVRYRTAFATTRYRTGTWVTAARGETTVQDVTLSDGHRTWSERCDVLCTGYGLVPNTSLPRLLECAAVDGAIVVDHAQATSVPGVYAAGEVTGVGGVELALLEGEIAGLVASGRVRDTGRLVARRARAQRGADRLASTFAVRAEVRALATAGTIVCRCEDVPLGALDRSWSPRQAKLYTRAGMGACQGRVCGPALQTLFGWAPDTVRPPAQATLVSTLHADASLEACRPTPSFESGELQA